jgi:hypothetical protein
MDESAYLTKAHPPGDDGAIVVVATMMFEGKEAMFPGCLMYHQAPPDSPQSLDLVRTKRSAAEMDDPLDPITSKFWVTSLASGATMGGRNNAVVAGICISESPRRTGPAQLALMVSGVATLKLNPPITPDPSPGELLVIDREPTGPPKYILRVTRFLPPDLRYLLHWPPSIESDDVFAGDDGDGPFAPLVTAMGGVPEFAPPKPPRPKLASAARYLAFMAGNAVTPDAVYADLLAFQTQGEGGIEPYLHPFGAFARVLDTGPDGTVRVLLKGML